MRRKRPFGVALPFRVLPALLALACLLGGRSLLAVTITEIHYNPPGSDSGLEFIELHNDGPTVVDISDWAFTAGVDFTFPRGTWIAGGGYLALCADETAFRAAYPNAAVVGPFSGRLDSSGEELILSNNGGAQIVRLRYGDRGKWPSLPAGTGHTLSLRSPRLDPAEPESWTASALPGGTPGAPNFGAAGSAPDVEVIALGATWFYKKGTQEFSNPVDAWKQLTYDTTGWLQGPSGFGYGDGDDATDLSADMPNAYLSVAVRKTFQLSQSFLDSPDLLLLSINYDDGFVAYVNGTEVARVGILGSPVPFDATADNHEAGLEDEFVVPRTSLAAGTNVIAIEGHNANLGSTDFSLAPRLLRRKASAPPGGGSSGSGMVFNEFLGRSASARWLELYNDSAASTDISGFFLSDSAAELQKYAFPAGSILPARGYLVVTEAQCGLDFAAAEVRLFLTLPDASASLLGAIFENVPSDGVALDRTGYSDARWPNGKGDFAFAATPTPGAANQVAINSDVVINEIMYHAPAVNAAGEYLELFNRGAQAVNLSSWAFTKGVSYQFPPGTQIPSQGYLVIAQDPAALQAVHGISGVLGPWVGNLANSGEAIRLRDAVGNTADEVRYYDGGPWSEWADGGGSSLELIDPRQDNSLASAWDASDESAKAQWTFTSYSGSFSYEVPPEVHLILPSAGTVHFDDISLVRQGQGIEYMSNGTFETGTAPWLFLGTHVASNRITTDAHSGSACLELNAGSGGDNNANKAEVDTSTGLSAGTYTLSYWTKWVRGVDKVITRIDSLSGGNLQRMVQLNLPAKLGTPGAVNSVRSKILPSGNLGPVIGEVTQVPVTPGPGNEVQVRARAHDADGITSLTIQYRLGGVGNGLFTSVPMFDDGAHGDGQASDGVFTGVIPPQATSSRVVFFLEGTDTSGNSRRFPVAAPTSTLLYSVESPANTPLFKARLNLTDENTNELRSRPLHSDDLLEGSLAFNDEEIFYNVGVRYHGSPWNRPPDPKMFRIALPADHLFLHRLRSINLSRYGSVQNEGIANVCVQSAGLPHSPAPVVDYYYTRVFHNAANHGLMAIMGTVDSEYTERWFPGDGDGYIYKLPGRRWMNDTGVMEQVDWSNLIYRGGTAGSPEEFERYRWYFPPGSHQEENRYADLNRLCSILDVNRTTTVVLDAQIETILDVEQFMRVEAARTLQDDWDTIGIGNGQNAYIYYAPIEGRFKLFPWDMDHTFGNVGAKLFPEGSEAQITRLVQRPKFRRMYLRATQQMLQTSWDSSYIGPYMNAVQSVAGIGDGGILGFITQRRPSVVALAPTSTEFKATHIGSFTIPPNWPGVYYSTKTSERVRGTAPLEVESIIAYRNGEPLDTPIIWGTTTWSLDCPVIPGPGLFEFFAFSVEGDLISSTSLSILSTDGWQAPQISDVEPVSGSTAGGEQVTIRGTDFHPAAKVFFGTAQSTNVTVNSDTEIVAAAPVGTAGKVAIKVQNADTQFAEMPEAFEYIQPIVFVRGDATLDGSLDLADAIKTIFYLFAGGSLDCLEAADVDDSGQISVTDVIADLDYLFRGGQAPAAPFPQSGEDSAAADGLDCATGL